MGGPAERDRDALAVSLGLLPPTHDDLPDWAPHPVHRAELGDDGIAAVISGWNQAAAAACGVTPANTMCGDPDCSCVTLDPDAPICLTPVDYGYPPLCGLCGGGGLYTTTSALTGHLVTVTCPSCGGES